MWVVTLTGPGEEVLAISPKRPHDSVHSQGRVLADRRVLYKYLNTNFVASVVQRMDDAKKRTFLVNLYVYAFMQRFLKRISKLLFWME